MSSVVLEWNPGSYFIAVFLTALFSNTPTPTCTAPARVLPARTPRFTSSSIPIINRGLESLWSRFSVKTNHMWVQPPGRNTKRFVDLKIRIVTQVLCLYNLLISTTNLNLHLYNDELYWMLCLLNTGLSHTAKIQFYSSMALTKIVRSIKSSQFVKLQTEMWNTRTVHTSQLLVCTSRDIWTSQTCSLVQMYFTKFINGDICTSTILNFEISEFYKLWSLRHLYFIHFQFETSAFYKQKIWDICTL